MSEVRKWRVVLSPVCLLARLIREASPTHAERWINVHSSFI